VLVFVFFFPLFFFLITFAGGEKGFTLKSKAGEHSFLAMTDSVARQWEAAILEASATLNKSK
jgi:hypothetical protein